MKLNKEQFIKHVNEYHEMLDKETQILNILGGVAEWEPREWLNNYYDFLSEMCELEDSSNGTILDWFCFETNFGEDEPYILTEEPDGAIVEIVIDSAGVLYDYLVTYEIPSYEKEN